METVLGNIDVAAAVRRQLDKGIDVAERFATIYKNGGGFDHACRPELVSKFCAELEAGGIHISTTSAIRAKVEEDAKFRLLQQQEAMSDRPPEE